MQREWSGELLPGYSNAYGMRRPYYMLPNIMDVLPDTNARNCKTILEKLYGLFGSIWKQCVT